VFQKSNEKYINKQIKEKKGGKKEKQGKNGHGSLYITNQVGQKND